MGYIEPEERRGQIEPEDLRGALRTNPTEAELACLIEMTNRNEHAAAAALGMSLQTVKNHLSKLYTRIGALSRTQAVVICWPIVGAFLLPDVDALERVHPPFVERRLGLERRGRPAAAIAAAAAPAAVSPEPIDFGAWLDGKLRERDWSNGLLAAKSGVAKSTISRVRRGQRKPTLEIADALSRGLRASFVLGRRVPA